MWVTGIIAERPRPEKMPARSPLYSGWLKVSDWDINTHMVPKVHIIKI